LASDCKSSGGRGQLGSSTGTKQVLTVAWKRKLLCAACVLTAIVILIAGLWPFNPRPRNEVSWLTDENGLRFGDNGTVYSSDAFAITGPSPCSLEVWLQPAVEDDTNTILAFYTPEGHVPFSLDQFGDSLALRREVRPEGDRKPNSEVWIEHAFRGRKLLFIAISSDTRQTEVFVDGEIVRTAPRFELSRKDLSGQLVLGTSPVAYATWAGDMRGIAIYGRALTPAEVKQRFHAWTANGPPEQPLDPNFLVALYRFDERAGPIVHNLASGPNLYIPDRFTILHKSFLSRPRNEFHFDLGYLKDVLLNIGGFIPLGFFCCAYFGTVQHWRRAALTAILLGAAMSLAIEILQFYIPSRDSGMTDVITNTTGTVLGVALERSKILNALLTRAGVAL
jgi:hypothetical protein